MKIIIHLQAGIVIAGEPFWIYPSRCKSLLQNPDSLVLLFITLTYITFVDIPFWCLLNSAFAALFCSYSGSHCFLGVNLYKTYIGFIWLPSTCNDLQCFKYCNFGLENPSLETHLFNISFYCSIMIHHFSFNKLIS